MASTLEVTPLSGSLGAEIRGIDLARPERPMPTRSSP